MNTVCLYVFWNAHEPRPDEFDFTGQNDLAEFVRLCQANGMNVILRPGPYVCAEWGDRRPPLVAPPQERHSPARGRPLFP